MRDRRTTLLSLESESGTLVDALLDLDPSSTVGEVADKLGVPELAVDGISPEDSLAAGNALLEGSAVRRTRPLESSDETSLELVATAGRLAGQSWALKDGVTVIGREDSDVVLVDESVSARHASLLVDGSRLVIKDEGSTNGTIVEGVLIARAESIETGVEFAIGHTTFEARRRVQPDAKRELTGRGTVAFSRPAQLSRLTRLPDSIKLREEAGRERQVPPIAELMITLAASASIGVVGVLVWNRWEFVALIAAGAVAAALRFVYQRRRARKENRAVREEAEARHARESQQVAENVRAELQALRATTPDPAEVTDVAIAGDQRLWRRRRSDALLARVGVADRPSQTVAVARDGDDPVVVRNAPVSIDLAATGVLGIEGSEAQTTGVARGIIMQAASLHAPDDVRIVVLAPGGWDRWRWVRWLPHARLAGSLCTLAIDASSVEARVAELKELIGTLAATRDDRAPLAGPRVLVVAEHASELRSVPGFVDLVRDGPEVGVLTVALATGRAASLEEQVATLAIEESGLANLDTPGEDVSKIRTDLWPGDRCEAFARALAPVVLDQGAEGGIPDMVTYLEQYPEATDANAVTIAWRGSAGPTVSAEVLRVAGGVADIDLDRDYHLVVTGANRSGKTEFVLSLLIDLMRRNRPDELEVFIVGWKGTGDFERLRALPHLQRLASDSDVADAVKAITSLRAELQRRKDVFAQLMKEGRLSASSIVAAWAEAPDLAREHRLTRIVVVGDEFAQIQKQRPDFALLVNDIAKEGAGLGIHLVLAAQKPEGAITGDVDTNAKLRLAFMALTPTDSKQTIDSVDASMIDSRLKGRGFARTKGAGLKEFQGFRITGQSSDDRTTSPPRVVSLTAATWCGEPPEVPVERGPQRVDMDAVIDAINAAAADLELLDRPPLFPGPLEDVESGPQPLPLRCGTVDDVTSHVIELRRQPLLMVPSEAGTIGVVGSDASARMSVLVSMCSALDASDVPVEIATVDLVGSSLRLLQALPSVGASIDNDPWLLSWLVSRLETEARERRRALERHGSIEAQHASGEQPLPYLYVVINGWDIAKRDAALTNARFPQRLIQVLRAGAEAGVRGVIAGESAVLDHDVADLCRETWVLDVVSSMRKQVFRNDEGRVPVPLPAGRAFNASLVEAQFDLLGSDPAAIATEVERHSRSSIGRPATHLVARAFPSDLAGSDLPSADAPNLVLGLSGADPAPLVVDMSRRPAVVLSGGRAEDRVAALRALAGVASESWTVGVLGRDPAGWETVTSGRGRWFDLRRVDEDELADIADERLLMVVEDLQRFAKSDWAEPVKRVLSRTGAVLGAIAGADMISGALLTEMLGCRRWLVLDPAERDLVSLGLNWDDAVVDGLGGPMAGLWIDDGAIDRVLLPDR